MRTSVIKVSSKSPFVRRCKAKLECSKLNQIVNKIRESSGFKIQSWLLCPTTKILQWAKVWTQNISKRIKSNFRRQCWFSTASKIKWNRCGYYFLFSWKWRVQRWKKYILKRSRKIYLIFDESTSLSKKSCFIVYLRCNLESLQKNVLIDLIELEDEGAYAIFNDIDATVYANAILVFMLFSYIH